MSHGHGREPDSERTIGGSSEASGALKQTLLGVSENCRIRILCWISEKTQSCTFVKGLTASMRWCVGCRKVS